MFIHFQAPRWIVWLARFIALVARLFRRKT